MLLGAYFAKLDEKSRLAVPKKVRSELGNNLVASRWYEGCILLVDKNSWSQLVSRLTGGELATLSARDTDRFLLAGSFELELDKQSRFIVPLSLRNYAKIKREVIFAGLGNRVEIWDKNAWEEHEKEIMDQAGAQIEKLYRERREDGK
ncbi:division/cell wall cluster transcriptional repressor MraZ [Candidatus Microgenomates bacterium]|nr:division/cell wall cluster transcriptional repressor MraZ [Candidatus Microgenomates bacterium]